MRVVALLCIALCVSAALAADSQQAPSTWINDYLSNPKASPMSEYREELEKATMCFHTAAQCIPKDAVPAQYLSTLSCSPCPEAHYHKYDNYYGDDDYDTMGAVLGNCMFTTFMLPAAAIVPLDFLGKKPGITWAGTFIGTCFLDKSGHGEHCELPEGCDNSRLEIQGVIYDIVNAVRVGPIKGTPVDICGKPPGTGGGKAPAANKVAKTASTQAAVNNLPVASATVWDGDFIVHGGHHKKWKEGRFQYSFFTADFKDTPYAETIGYPRLGDDTYKLEFFGHSKY